MDEISINRTCPKCGGSINVGNEMFIKGAKINLKEFLASNSVGGAIGKFAGSELIDKTIEVVFAGSEFVDKTIDSLLGRSKAVCEKCGYKWTKSDEIETLKTSIKECVAKTIEEQPRDCTQFYSSMKQLDSLINSIQSAESKDLDKDFLLWDAYRTKGLLYFHKSANYLGELLETDDLEWNEFYSFRDHALSATDESFNYIDNCSYRKSYSTELYARITYQDALALTHPELYTDVFTILLGALMNDDQERNIKINDFLYETKNTMVKAWTPDEYGDCGFQFTRNIEYDDRKIIFIAKSEQDVAGYWDRTDSINYIFTPDCIPPDIKFPLGRPNVNTLYIANPVKSDEYIPYDNHEQALFGDKIRELRRLLRSLGATEITFTSMRGASIEEIEKRTFSVNAGGHYKIHKASGGVSVGNRQVQKRSANQKVDYIEKLDPDKYPVLPDDLYWFDSDPEWKDIVEARLHHNQLHFEQSISTNQVSSLDKQTQLDVNAAYENLIFCINANYHREREFHVKTTQETMWRITAEFKPLSEFVTSDSVETAQKNFTRNEQKYITAVKRYLGEGGISERDRQKLNLLLKPLGISKEHADELEASLVPHLSEGEKDYLEAVSVYKEDGIINESDRLTLEEIRVAYSISENRARQLESMV